MTTEGIKELSYRLYTDLTDNDVSGLSEAVTAVKTLILSRWIPRLSTANDRTELLLNTSTAELHWTPHLT